jgi:bacteriocin resistance YdeI/OmpD-like protein/uncharacterized protein DUF1905
MPQQFSAKIYKLGINPCLDVPKRVSQAFGQRGYVPVKGTLNEQPIRATLVPKGDFRHRLFLNTDMRQRAGLDVGDRAHLVLEMDRETRTQPIPDELALALGKNPQARAAFEGLAPSKQKEILSYLNWIKRPETLKRNVEKTIANLIKHVKN